MTPTVHILAGGPEEVWRCVNCGAQRAWGSRRGLPSDADPGGMYVWPPDRIEEEEEMLGLRLRREAVAETVPRP